MPKQRRPYKKRGGGKTNQFLSRDWRPDLLDLHCFLALNVGNRRHGGTVGSLSHWKSIKNASVYAGQKRLESTALPTELPRPFESKGLISSLGSLQEKFRVNLRCSHSVFGNVLDQPFSERFYTRDRPLRPVRPDRLAISL